MNIKILHWKASSDTNKNESEQKPSYKISEDAGYFTIACHVPFNKNANDFRDIKVSFDTLKYKGEVYDFYAKDEKERSMIEPVQAYRYIYHRGKNTACSGQTYLFRIAVDPSGSSMAVVLGFQCENIAGYENSVMEQDGGMTGIAYLMEEMPFVRNIVDKSVIKYDMLKEIDEHDSISYLEAQVDILTRIILSKMNKGDNLYDLLKLADDSSVLDVKSEDSIKEEFTDKKAKVRKYQKKYISRKEDI